MSDSQSLEKENTNWDTQRAKQVAETILKTKADTTEVNKKMKEMKTQMLDYMKQGDMSDFPMADSQKILKAVDSPIRFTLIEAIRAKFSQDGVNPGKIDDWLREVKDIRRAGIKSTKRVMKITRIRKEKEKKEKAAKAGAKGTPASKKGGRKGKVRFAGDQTEMKDSEEGRKEVEEQKEDKRKERPMTIV